MVTIPFQKPDKVLMIESTDSFGVFEFRPLQPNYGVTIGNALRRVLLSSLEGYAITSLKIEGVAHEFATIPGVIEDVTDIVLNVKQIRLKSKLEDQTSEKIKVTITGKNEFVAGDINEFLNNFQVLNPDLHICSMEPNVKLEMELTIDKGRGYVTVDENKLLHEGTGVIVIDSIHTPIINVMYRVENYRVEQKTDFEKLIFEITTDGSVHPKEALKKAADVLIQHFALFTDKEIDVNTEQVALTNEFDEQSLHIRQLLKQRLQDMDLSVRALNCLKTAEVETLGELVTYQKADLLKFRNFGKKSLNELEDLVKSKGLEFGMNVSKYKLDQEK
ncbi:MAG: DNA-directed RNA polymerase subunit alpha [Bacteroidales bacterium]|jgi:DNA-directed RNA polymerase subunit alpha|nr:DNA-directed RNA polymerase subunit alpha [Bacteroidales bacterium]MBQ4478234.1 DNA-directed RNA polymerase subunit alpha [Bacteroidales bacterium]MBR4453630.1 DNA-directed RNA polymerase subunit alpha [Bacteroidales bacterium]